MNGLPEVSERSAKCWRCNAAVSPQDRYCHNCGAGQGSLIPWYYSHLGIILLTVLAIGPFSLYLVWKSPKLSAAARRVYTVLILAYTALLAVLCWNAYRLMMQMLSGYELGA